MKRFTSTFALTLLACSFFTGCMTEADKALWVEAKETLGSKDEAIAEKDQAPASPDEEEATQPSVIKTSKDAGGKPVDKR